MTTTTIDEQIQALKCDLEESQDLLTQAKAIEIPDSPDTSRSISWTWLIVGLGVGIGVGVKLALMIA